MFKKYVILLKESNKKHVSFGLVAGLMAFILCLCIAIISVVYSPSVYQAAYRKGCVDSAYNIDSDNFDKYYTVLTDFLTNNDPDILASATFKANDEIQNIFNDEDIELLKSYGNSFVLIRAIAILSAIIMAVIFVVLGFKRGKKAISETACWALVMYLSLFLIFLLWMAVDACSGGNAVAILYQVLSLGALTSYGGGNLSLFYGVVTMQAFASALLTMVAVFGVILLVVILSLCKLIFKKHRDENEDFLYQ